MIDREWEGEALRYIAAQEGRILPDAYLLPSLLEQRRMLVKVRPEDLGKSAILHFEVVKI